MTSSSLAKQTLAHIQGNIRQIGADLSFERRLCRIRLRDTSKATGISVANLSRIERGDFKRMTAETYLLLRDYIATLQLTKTPARTTERKLQIALDALEEVSTIDPGNDQSITAYEALSQIVDAC